MNSIVEAIEIYSKKNPNKVAIIIDGEAVTYQELLNQIFAFASSLKDKKIPKNCRVLIEADDIKSYLSTFLACHLYGCIAVPIEKNISIYKLQDILNITKPKLVFMKNNGERYEDYLNCKSNHNFMMPKADSDCTITSTTGTTGKPSQVLHNNLSMYTVVENLAVGTHIDEDCILYTQIPLDTAAGYRRVFACFITGATAVVSSSFLSMNDIAKNCQKYQVSHLSLLCSDIIKLVEDVEDVSSLNDLKIVESVTGELPAGITSLFYQKFQHIDLYNVYGTTESGCVLINNTRDNYKDNCLGKPSCNSQICLLDENEIEIDQPGKYGHVTVSGPMNMTGYYRKKEMTSKVISGGRVILNDIVYFDENGYYYFVSRVGDIINVQGYKIPPSNIERVACGFSGIKDCACVGKNDGVNGQIPVLFVELESEDTFPMDKFREYLDNNLESYAVPKEILKINKIPRTISGKLMRRSLLTVL